jgi:hypothetical protein
MTKESVLTEAQKESILIKKFIFHIIMKEELNPQFLDEVELTTEQLEFFKKRFIDAAEGTQFLFNDTKTSEVYKNCKAIIENPEKEFIEISRQLTASFKTHHKASMNDGVFITALVSVLGKEDLIFLIKIDHRNVYEYLTANKKARMKKIERTFVEDKRAVQKIAIIDIGDYFVWDVLAFDRSPSAGKPITDYFANFLAVYPRETPSILTTRTISEIRKWANANKSDLGQEPSAYKGRCIEYLRNHTQVKFTDLVNMVTYDENGKRKEKLKISLKAHLQQVGLYGQTFKPNTGSLKEAERKNILKTAEGIKIEWDGVAQAKDVNMEISAAPDMNGMYRISIQTSEIEFVK